MKKLLLLLAFASVPAAAFSQAANPLWHEEKITNYLPHMTWPEVQALRARTDMVIIPIAAMEQHALHLPIGTDFLNGLERAKLIAQKAAVLVAPILLPGNSPYHMEFPGTITLSSQTIQQVYFEAAQSLIRHGFTRFLLLNSHGGNDLKPLLRELYGKTTVNIFLCNWYTAIGELKSEIFTHPDDHAGEMETSFGLAYFPDLVGRNADGTLIADDGKVAKSRFEAVNKGWISITRPWHLLTTNSGSGYPHEATAEKGRKLIDVVVQRLSPFLVELSAAKLDEKFPF